MFQQHIIIIMNIETRACFVMVVFMMSDNFSDRREAYQQNSNQVPHGAFLSLCSGVFVVFVIVVHSDHTASVAYAYRIFIVAVTVSALS